MKIVVTGGSGLIGAAAIDELIRRGHHIRLLARHAEDDVKRWPERVEPWNGNVADASSVARACEGYDAVLHIAGIAQEEPPDLTFDAVNVEGTRNIVREADRAALRRFVFVSSLGADRGQSAYHQSKRAAERIVGEFSGEWLIVRPGNVYGPGDGLVSLLLEAARALPAVAVIDDGDQMFQPVWHSDLGRALAAAVERHDLHAAACEVAGNDLTSMNHLLERLGEITGRAPERIPVPGVLAKAGASIAAALGVRTPVTADVLQMLDEENVVRDPAGNALTRVFGVKATPLDAGLRVLAGELPEQLPRDGVGPLQKKRFMADIAGSRYGAPEMFRLFLANFQTVVPFDFDAGRPAGGIREGTTLTGRLPVRGTFQVRVEALSERHMSLVTVGGHPLAGAASFFVDEHGERIFFEIQLYARAADLADFIAMKSGFELIQDLNWARIVERVIALSGGTAVEGIQTAFETVGPEEEQQVNLWLDRIVTETDVKRRGMGGEEEGRRTRV